MENSMENSHVDAERVISQDDFIAACIPTSKRCTICGQPMEAVKTAVVSIDGEAWVARKRVCRGCSIVYIKKTHTVQRPWCVASQNIYPEVSVIKSRPGNKFPANAINHSLENPKK